MRGSSARSTAKRSSSSSSQSSVSSDASIVRDAFVASVTCTSPPVSFQTSQVSTVPNASPARPCSRRSHSSFVAEKYGSGTSPVRSRIKSGSSSRQRAAVRRSCQTIAGATGRPVARSQSSVVSRWFVIATRSTPSSPASPAAARTLCQISSGSCSTQPGRGKCCGSSA